MLLTFALCHVVPLPEIKECKNKNPNQIDKMPIKPHGFDFFVGTLTTSKKTFSLFSCKSLKTKLDQTWRQKLFYVWSGYQY